MSDDPVHVVAGALIDPRGRVLIAQRPPGKAHAGRWEFPGGKKLAFETPRDALNRELLEELGIQVAGARPLLAVTHRYAADSPPVLIDCWTVEAWRGEIAALDGQALRWCERDQLAHADILEADRPIVTALRLPATFVREDEPAKLARRVPGPRGRERVAWLVPALPEPALAQRLRAHGDAFFLLDVAAGSAVGEPAAASGAANGDALQSPPGGPVAPVAPLRGRVIESAAQAHAARSAGADFLLVPDRSFPDAELAAVAAVGLPFYLNLALAAATRTRPAIAATGRLWWPPAREAALL